MARLSMVPKSAFTSQRLYSAACLYGNRQRTGDFIGLAFPDTELHRKYLEPLKAVLDSLQITVYLVHKDSSVHTFVNAPRLHIQPAKQIKKAS